MKKNTKTYKLYDLPEYANTKLYFGDTVIIFDHLDGLYSYCWYDGDKSKITHVIATTTFIKHKDGFKYVDEGR